MEAHADRLLALYIRLFDYYFVHLKFKMIYSDELRLNYHSFTCMHDFVELFLMQSCKSSGFDFCDKNHCIWPCLQDLHCRFRNLASLIWAKRLNQTPEILILAISEDLNIDASTVILKWSLQPGIREVYSKELL